MAPHENLKQIFSSFTASNTPQWAEAAKAELNGADPFEKLSFAEDGLKIKPYYDFNDRPKGYSFALPPSTDLYLGARAWQNMPRIIVANEKEANKAALNALNSGADGILFQIISPTLEIDSLLDQIDVSYCSLSFLLATGTSGFITELQKKVQGKLDLKFNGSVFFNEPSLQLASLFRSWPTFRHLGVVVPPANATEELVYAILEVLKIADELTDNGWMPEEVFKHVAVLISLDSNFFLSIAKLKALRILWQQLLKAYEADPGIELSVHTLISPDMPNKYQPQGYLLKSTTAGLASVLGGCNAMTVDAEEDKSMNHRIARNVSAILREESHLSKVADPTAGAYYIDNLTMHLAQQAWEQIKHNA